MIYDNIPRSRMNDGGFVLGYDDAPITIIAFEDFLCPHCQAYQPILDTFIKQHVATGNARFEYRDWAIHGKPSIRAFSLAECATQQGVSFWDAHHTLFEMAGDETFTDDHAQLFATRVGIDLALLDSCTDDAEQFRTDAALAQHAGVVATPTIGIRRADGHIDLDTLPRQPNLDQLTAVIENATDN